MSTTQELVERLRKAAHWAISENDHFEPELGVEAAEKIAELERENARMRERLSHGHAAMLEVRKLIEAMDGNEALLLEFADKMQAIVDGFNSLAGEA